MMKYHNLSLSNPQSAGPCEKKDYHKLKAMLIIIFILVAVVAYISLIEWMRFSTTEIYADYKCYDQNLRSINSYWPKGRYSVKDKDEDYIYRYVYTKIIGESDEMFIDVKRGKQRFLEYSVTDNGVYQNPNSYVDVIAEWSIKEIILCGIGSDEKLTATKSEDIFSELKYLVADSKRAENATDEDLKSYETRWYLCVIFDESKNIVWDSAVTVYFDMSVNCHMIMISDGRGEKIVIPPESKLYEFISERTGG